MTDEQHTGGDSTSRLGRLVRDSRARIPFALIAVVLLVSAGLFVLSAETGSERTVDDDPDLAMDRTAAAAETAVRDGTTRATELAARQPLTTVSGTPYGQALDEEAPLESYLEALVYLEVSERLDGAGQQVGDVRTTVRVPNVTDSASFADAVDRVSVTPGRESSDLEDGKVRASVEDVVLEAHRNGETIDRRRTEVEVTVPSPLFELHDRTQEYEQRLNAGITESGFGQRFNARIYALGWARGYAQYAGAPVTEVIANRHVVPAANDAIYRTQRDVFGAADPNLNNAIRRGWLCMAMQDAEELYAGYSSGGGGTNVSQRLCDASRWIFGRQAIGNPPESPGVTDLLGEAPGMNASHTVALNETAKIPLAAMLSGDGEHSLWEAVDRIYTIETLLDLSVENVDSAAFDHSPPARYTGSGRRLSLQTRDVSVTVETVENLSDPGEFYRIEGSVSVRLEERRRFTDEGVNETHSVVTEATDGLTADIALELVESETSPNSNIETYVERRAPDPASLPPDYEYERGPTRAPSDPTAAVPGAGSSDGFVNYAQVDDKILDEVVDIDAPFGELDGQTAHSDRLSPASNETNNVGATREEIEQWLEVEWDEARSASDLTLPATVEADVLGSAVLGSDIKQTIVADLARMQERVSGISVTFERSEVVQTAEGRGPFARLHDQVREQREEFLTRETAYENVGQKAVYEARDSYFEMILQELERLDSAHGEAMDALDTELDDLGIDDALSYLQQGLTAEPPDPVPMESSSLTSDVTYEVSGSPTYLVTERVTSKDVPAVRRENNSAGFDPLAASNRNYLKLPYEAVVDGILSRVANFLGLGDPDAELTFRMAGEALRAGDLASDAAEQDDYGDVDDLDGLTDEVEAATEDAIDDFETEAAAQIAFRLYPDDVVIGCLPTTCGEMRDHFGEYIDCNEDDCELRPGGVQKCTSTYCAMEEESTGVTAIGRIEPAVEGAVGDYGSRTSERAMAIDEGNLTGPISQAAADAVSESNRPAHADALGKDEWEELVRSVAEHAITNAANEQHVTLDDTETIEALDEEVRQALEAVSADILAERMNAHFGGTEFNLSNYDNWVDGVDTPVRVPAGMPLLPLPNLWFATVNVWDVDVEGEYARFEVTANQGTPDRTSGVTYVREQRTIDREIAGQSRQLGHVEPINFDGKSVLVVIVPPGGIGVGDRDDEDPELSPTWPGAGYNDSAGPVGLG